jgi:hypothetical protein
MLMGRRDRATPAFWGAVGGAVAFAGKTIPPETHSLQGLAGFGLNAIGVSIVANAADGLAPLARVIVPLGPMRLRVVSGDGPTLQFAVNAHDAIFLATRVHDPDLRFDLRRTLTSGAVSFLAVRRPIISGIPPTVDGVTVGSVMVMSEFAVDPAGTWAHELVHAHQLWFMSENWTKPLEDDLRVRVGLLRWIPRWLDVGVVMPFLLELETRVLGFGNGPLTRSLESEANWFERR